MTDIKRLTELAGLKEYAPTAEFVTLDRAASDALSAFQSKNNTDPLEKVVQYHAMKNGVDYEELLATVSRYIENPQELMPSGAVSKMGEDYNDTSYFEGEGFKKIWDKIKQAEAELGPLGKQRYDLVLDNFPISVKDAYAIVDKINKLEAEQKGMGEDYNNTEADETITFSVNDEKGYNAIMDRYKDHISWDGEYMVASEVVFARIEDLFASMGIDGPREMGSEDDYDGQPSEREEWQDYMGGDDWDHGQYDESGDLGRMYEEYQEQLAFEEFQNDLEEAVTFAGGKRPPPRKDDLEQRFTRAGTTDIAKDIRTDPMEPHSKTDVGGEKSWQHGYPTADLGASLGFKTKIDSDKFEPIVPRDFKTWVGSQGEAITANGTRDIRDKMGNLQNKSETWSTKGRHEDIVAFAVLTGSAGNFQPGTYMRSDVATPEMIQRGRELGR
ncbi:hypothetical protein LCGC14_0794050 [marine sediment metagenome]|uniref:Uncharacterized protein n=1 Tax=marine sediment metagenome TaxID=412755 RepID=A0A0F9QBI5_9ZZZZ